MNYNLKEVLWYFPESPPPPDMPLVPHAVSTIRHVPQDPIGNPTFPTSCPSPLQLTPEEDFGQKSQTNSYSNVSKLFEIKYKFLKDSISPTIVYP